MMELVPAPVAAAVAVLVGVLVTGAFHEDGLADLADSMGGWTPEQRREILKDSRHGSYGVAALCGSIVLRIVCVATLGPAVAFAGLVTAHTLGRSAAVGVMIAGREPVTHVGARPRRRLGRGQLRTRSAATGVIAGLAIGVLATGWWALPLALGAAVGASAGRVARDPSARDDQRRRPRRGRTGRRMHRPRDRHRPRHPPPPLVDLTAHRTQVTASSFHVCDKKLMTGAQILSQTWISDPERGG